MMISDFKDGPGSQSVMHVDTRVDHNSLNYCQPPDTVSVRLPWLPFPSYAKVWDD